MKKAQEIDVKGTSVRIVKFGMEDYVCITDMAKSKSDDAQQTISNWMRNRMTIEYLGLWEKLYNPDFKPFEFEGFRKEMSVSQTELAARMKASRPSVSKALHGGIDLTFVSAVRFAKALWLDFFRCLSSPQPASSMHPLPSYQHFPAMGLDPFWHCNVCGGLEKNFF